ncbi:MAG: diaminopimelate epimerase [Planctomycetaceae bacterium]|nr:diaminopimelate epimerase [Planctomycetaceae bacterium]
MTQLPFVKMQGAGNDYIFLDGFRSALPADPGILARDISDRHTGVGSDGLVTIERPTDDDCDAVMRMWNADGSQGLMCGNALRCVALRLHTHQSFERVRIRTATRVVTVITLQVAKDGQCGQFSADLGTATPATTLVCPRSEFPLLSSRDDLPQQLTLHSLSVGNPHAVVFTDHATDALVQDFGAAIARWSRFPEGTNVEWVETVNNLHLRVRVWERGSGETLACGSGACAVVAAGVQLGQLPVNQDVTVELPGGTLQVRQEPNERLQLRGPATVVFEGSWPLRAQKPRDQSAMP